MCREVLVVVFVFQADHRGNAKTNAGMFNPFGFLVGGKRSPPYICRGWNQPFVCGQLLRPHRKKEYETSDPGDGGDRAGRERAERADGEDVTWDGGTLGHHFYEHPEVDRLFPWVRE